MNARGAAVHSDPWIARIGLLLLGCVAIVATTGMMTLSLYSHEIPPALAGIAGSAASTLGVVVIALIRVGNGRYPPAASG